jgi:hypothetical protein
MNCILNRVRSVENRSILNVNLNVLCFGHIIYSAERLNMALFMLLCIDNLKEIGFPFRARKLLSKFIESRSNSGDHIQQHSSAPVQQALIRTSVDSVPNISLPQSSNKGVAQVITIL